MKTVFPRQWAENFESEDALKDILRLIDFVNSIGGAVTAVGNLSISSDTVIDSATWTSLNGFPQTISLPVQKALCVHCSLDWQANGNTIYELDVRVSIGGTVRRTVTIDPQNAFLITPHPTPLAKGVMAFSTAFIGANKGKWEIDIEARTNADGDYTILDTSVITYQKTLRGTVV